MLDFDQKLVAKIKEENIVPKPRWHFLLKNYVIWTAGALALLIGSATVSVMIYLFKYNNWEVRENMHKSFFEFFLLTLPYFWIIFLGLFIFLLYYNFKHTERGYKYPVWFIAITSILLSVILGGFFSLAGLGEKIDDVLGRQAPFYDKVFNRQISFWFNPAEGRLTGLVSGESEQSDFKVIDPSGHEWQIIIKDNLVKPKFLIIGTPVNMVGEIKEENVFEAELFKSVHPGRGFLFRRPLPPPMMGGGMREFPEHD